MAVKGAGGRADQGLQARHIGLEQRRLASGGGQFAGGVLHLGVGLVEAGEILGAQLLAGGVLDLHVTAAAIEDRQGEGRLHPLGDRAGSVGGEGDRQAGERELGEDRLAQGGVLGAVARLERQQVRSTIGQGGQGRADRSLVIDPRARLRDQGQADGGLKVQKAVQVPAGLLGVALGGGQLGLGVQLGGEIGRRDLHGQVMAGQGVVRAVGAVGGDDQHLGQIGGAGFPGERGLRQLPGLLGDAPLGPEQVQVRLPGRKLRGPAHIGPGQQGREIEGDARAVGGVTVGAGHGPIGRGGDLRVGQQAGGEHLGGGDLGRGALGRQVRGVEHRQDRDLGWGEALGRVDADRLQRGDPQLGHIDLQLGGSLSKARPVRQGPRVIGGAGRERQDRQRRHGQADAETALALVASPNLSARPGGHPASSLLARSASA